MNKLSENSEVKNRIRDELFQCMREMPYSKITIKNLVERLGMSRQNFYRYYMSKDEILLDLIDTTLDVVYQIVESNFQLISSDLGIIAEQIEGLVNREKNLINEILSCPNKDVVFSHLQTFIRRVAGRLLRENNHTNIDQDYLDIIISQYTGSGYHLIKAWAQSDGDLDKLKFTSIITTYIGGLFGAVELAAR
ncbi:MAG: TetR/AcrR family transcriptional regulator [Spongiibacteraceae bacterium]